MGRESTPESPPRRGFRGGAANNMIELVGESPILTIVRSGQVVISGIGGGNNIYESPEVNGQSAERKLKSERYRGLTKWKALA